MASFSPVYFCNLFIYSLMNTPRSFGDSLIFIFENSGQGRTFNTQSYLPQSNYLNSWSCLSICFPLNPGTAELAMYEVYLAR